MYFTDNKKLQRFEHDMKIVPNFERKEVWKYAESCRDCQNYESKLECCMEAHCPYLKRKIRSNAVLTRDLVETFLVDHPYIPFSHRVIDMLSKYKGNKLFYSKAHKKAFEAAIGEIPEDDYNHIACIYVLTMRPNLWECAVHTSKGYTCVMDLEQGDVLWVGKGRAMKNFEKFFKDIPSDSLSAVIAVAMDMNASYNKLVTKHLPKAQIVYDWFHMQAQLVREYQ